MLLFIFVFISDFFRMVWLCMFELYAEYVCLCLCVCAFVLWLGDLRCGVTTTKGNNCMEGKMVSRYSHVRCSLTRSCSFLFLLLAITHSSFNHSQLVLCVCTILCLLVNEVYESVCLFDFRISELR